MKQGNNVDQKTLPPNCIIAEEIVIGQLLSSSTARRYILKNTTSSFFALQKYRILYYYGADINKYRSAAETINELWNKKLLEKTGGILHVMHIISKSKIISTQYNQNTCIEYFIKILQKNYVKRLIVQYSYSVLQLNYFYKISIKQIQGKAYKYMNIIQRSKTKENQTNFRDSIAGFISNINQAAETHEKISSGFQDLDRITHGFKAGELIVIAGRPSMGKTSLAINIVHHAIFILQLQVRIFSLEMSKNEILDKLIALASNISIQKIQQRIIGKYEWSKIQKACKFLISSSLYINDHESSSIEYIKEQCKNYLSKKKLLLLLTICS